MYMPLWVKRPFRRVSDVAAKCILTDLYLSCISSGHLKTSCERTLGGWAFFGNKRFYNLFHLHVRQAQAPKAGTGGGSPLGPRISFGSELRTRQSGLLI